CLRLSGLRLSRFRLRIVGSGNAATRSMVLSARKSAGAAWLAAMGAAISRKRGPASARVSALSELSRIQAKAGETIHDQGVGPRSDCGTMTRGEAKRP